MDRKRKLLLTVLTVIGLCSIYEVCYHIFSSDYEYKIEDNAAVITYYKESEQNVTLPATLGGAPVIEIGSGAFYKNQSIRTVTIPDSVTVIGDGAFMDSALTSVDLPENLEQIQRGAFSNCVNLQAIRIPAKVSFIGEPFVYGCSQLKSIEVSGQNTDYVTWNGVLYTSDMETLLAYPAGRSPGECIIPAGVTRIAYGAFQDSAITSVSIPEGVKKINDFEFFGCKMLRRIDLPASLTEIEDCFDAMGSCDRLECINVSPDNQVYASLDGVLYDKGITKLLLYPRGRKESSFTVPNGVHSIEKQAFFGNDSLIEVILPDGMESIGDDSFAYCEKLERAVLPNSLKSIGDGAFSACINLYSIVLPGSLTTLGSDAFCLCLSLKQITIPRGITRIGDSAFCSCDGLVSIVIPPEVTSIDAEAFYQCPALVISGEAGSYAQTFARDNNIPFTITAGELPAGMIPYPQGRRASPVPLNDERTAMYE